MERAVAKSASSGTAARALLTCGVVAGPVYVVLGLIQMLIRDGFDIRRHALSLLANGDLGWIQTANFLLAGLLVIAGAAGMRWVLRGGQGRTWGPLLVGLYGLGLIGAGIFVADPVNGFPPGLPADAYSNVSWHGILHLVTGGIGFLGLIAGCFVFARRFSSLRERGWTAFSMVTGILFFAAFFGIAVGSQQGGAILTFVNLAFAAAVVVGWTWISAVSARLMNPDDRWRLPMEKRCEI